MSFTPSEVAHFLKIFEENKSKISGFQGCTHLELLQDIRKPNQFFTYSYWQNESFLEAYRNSALFNEVWQKTKILFNDKPEAWSVKSV